MKYSNQYNQLEWNYFIAQEKTKKYFINIIDTINYQISQGIQIFPSKNNILRSFKLCKLSNLKVVILGQDPYYKEGQADGLAFSITNSNIIAPPSLKNIYKEINSDLQIKMSNNYCLENWSKQGVLLLNSILTVQKNKPMSHYNIGWEIFTNKIIKIINYYKNNIVFLLWGKQAISKSIFINNNKHYILTSSHPSPFSASINFFGCKHFSKTNKYLKKNNIDEINWKL